MSRQRMRAHFAIVGEVLDSDRREVLATAAAADPGENILVGLELSQQLLADYERLLNNRAYAEAEVRRALEKADLHDRWRRRNARGSA